MYPYIQVFKHPVQSDISDVTTEWRAGKKATQLQYILLQPQFLVVFVFFSLSLPFDSAIINSNSQKCEMLSSADQK
jgi:hypothetical protein